MLFLLFLSKILALPPRFFERTCTSTKYRTHDDRKANFPFPAINSYKPIDGLIPLPNQKQKDRHRLFSFSRTQICAKYDIQQRDRLVANCQMSSIVYL